MSGSIRSLLHLDAIIYLHQRSEAWPSDVVAALSPRSIGQLFTPVHTSENWGLAMTACGHIIPKVNWSVIYLRQKTGVWPSLLEATLSRGQSVRSPGWSWVETFCGQSQNGTYNTITQQIKTGYQHTEQLADHFSQQLHSKLRQLGYQHTEQLGTHFSQQLHSKLRQGTSTLNN
jgi:hypothetical protein